MLVLDPPKSDIFLPAADQLISLDRAELDGQNVEIADLLSKKFRFPGQFDLADIKNKQSLSFVRVKPNHDKMFLMRESNLLYFLIGTLERTYTFMIDPNPN